MANGLPKRVVFKKPRITDKPVNLRAKAEDPQPKLKPEKRAKPVDKPKPEPVKYIEEPVIEVSENKLPEIIQTKSKRTIIVIKEPAQKPQTYATDTLFIDDIPRKKTFDEKFLDKMNIKSRITKDTKTLDKLTKPDIKPTVKSKTKEKRKLNPYIFISLMACVLLTIWAYKIIKDYLVNKLDGSLASFMYIVANILLVIITFIWFIIELTMENKK